MLSRFFCLDQAILCLNHSDECYFLAWFTVITYDQQEQLVSSVLMLQEMHSGKGRGDASRNAYLVPRISAR